MSTIFNRYVMVTARRKTVKGTGKVVGEYVGVISRASYDDYMIFSMLMEGHQVKLNFKSRTETTVTYEGTFAETIFTAELDAADADEFPNPKSVGTHVT